MSYNRFTLRFPDPLEQQFLKYSHRQDFRSFSIVAGAISILSACFIFLDIYRFPGVVSVVYARIILTLMLFGCYLGTRLIARTEWKYGYMVLPFLLISLYGAFLLVDHLGDMYDFFLYNITTGYIYFILGASGLKYRYAIPTTLTIFFGYYFYSQYFDITLNIKQAPGILTHCVMSFAIGYMIERTKRDVFLRNITIEEQKEEISQKNMALENLNDVKDKLISVISHDLKSPLNSVKTLLDLMDFNQLSVEEINELKKELHNKVDYTNDFVQRVQVWVRNQMGGFKPRFEWISIAEIADQCMNRAKASAERKNIKMINQVGEGVSIHADREMMDIVLRNLISNAIKFSEDGSVVEIRNQVESGKMSIAVSDNGKGMSAQSIRQIFSENPPPRNGQDSVGLGLVLCREFMEKNNGYLEVESVQHEGSTFFMVFAGEFKEEQE